MTCSSRARPTACSNNYEVTLRGQYHAIDADKVVASPLTAELAPFDLSKQLSSNRTQGIPNMIALIRETAERYA